MSKRIKFNVEGNLGYAADQVDSPINLGQLLEQVQEAIVEWGEDAEVVLHQVNNQYGANFGRIAQWELFEGPEGEEDEDDE